MDIEQVQILFSRTYNGIEYTDAIYMSFEDYNAKSDEEIEALKNERFNAWVYSLEHPVEPSVEEPQ